jgi:hypothetical protein
MLAFVSEPLNKFIWRERHSEKMRSICEHGSEQLQGNRKTFDFESAKHEKIDGLMLFASMAPNSYMKKQICRGGYKKKTAEVLEVWVRNPFGKIKIYIS